MLVALTAVLLGCTADVDPDRAADTEASAATPGSDTSSSPAATERSAAVDEASVDAALKDTLSDAVSGNLYPGMLVLIRSGNQTRVHSKGVANQRTGEPLTARHRFRAAVNEPILAAVALQLVQEQKLRLDERLETYLPGLLDNGTEISLEQLLNHSSGLADFAEAPDFWRLVSTAPPDPRELVKRADNLGPAFEPGSDAAYSPTNPVVLGLIVEEVTGRSLAEVLDERIFRTLGMTDSSVGWSSRSKAPVAHGYSQGEDVTRSNEVAWASATGGVMSTARDISRFLQALLGGEVVAPQLLQQMTTPSTEDVFPTFDYGLGLAHADLRCGQAYGDGGSAPGYISQAWTLETLDREVVVMVNTFDEQTPGGDVERAVEQALCP